LKQQAHRGVDVTSGRQRLEAAVGSARFGQRHGGPPGGKHSRRVEPGACLFQRQLEPSERRHGVFQVAVRVGVLSCGGDESCGVLRECVKERRPSGDRQLVQLFGCGGGGVVVIARDVRADQ
jgi:hypothetical protein